MDSFLSYIKSYIRLLSMDKKSMALKRLVKEASFENVRLREPLFCYAMVIKRVPRLLKLMDNLLASLDNEELPPYWRSELCPLNPEASLTALRDEFSGILEMCGGKFSRFYEMLQNKDPRLPFEYIKVYNDYIWCRDYRKKCGDDIKEYNRRQALAMQKNIPD